MHSVRVLRISIIDIRSLYLSIVYNTRKSEGRQRKSPHGFALSEIKVWFTSEMLHHLLWTADFLEPPEQSKASVAYAPDLPQVLQDHRVPGEICAAYFLLGAPQSSSPSHRYHERRCIRKHCPKEEPHRRGVDLPCQRIRPVRERLWNSQS